MAITNQSSEHLIEHDWLIHIIELLTSIILGNFENTLVNGFDYKRSLSRLSSATVNQPTCVVPRKCILGDHFHLLDDFPAVAKFSRRLIGLGKWYYWRIPGLHTYG